MCPRGDVEAHFIFHLRYPARTIFLRVLSAMNEHHERTPTLPDLKSCLVTLDKFNKQSDYTVALSERH